MVILGYGLALYGVIVAALLVWFVVRVAADRVIPKRHAEPWQLRRPATVWVVDPTPEQYAKAIEQGFCDEKAPEIDARYKKRHPDYEVVISYRIPYGAKVPPNAKDVLR